MKETLHQFPLPARPLQGHRFKLGLVCFFLLVLLATGLGLLAKMTILDSPLASTQKEEALAARIYLLRDQAVSPSGSLQEILDHPDIIPTHHHPLLGRLAPDFELADIEGKICNLRELRNGKPVVLIFYYGYHCIACVRQLFNVNKELSLFHEVGAQVVAISADPPELTRRRFQQYGSFGFPVLSDPGNKVAQAYLVFKGVQDGEIADSFRHGTFVIDRNGVVQWVNIGDAPFRRNSALLCQLAKLEGRLPSVLLGP